MCVSPAWAQQSIAGSARARITDRMVVGGSTFGEVMRIVGSPTVSSGTGTMNPAIIDADGDVVEDSNTTVSTAGAWTFGAAGSFTSTLGVTGLLSGNTGTLLLGDTRVTGTTPSFWLHDSDAASSEKFTALEADGGLLTLKLYDDTPSASNVVFQLDRDGLVPGDFRFGSLVSTIRCENNGGCSGGSQAKKFLTLNAWELWVDTLVAKETIATIGGRIFVAPTTKLKLDMASADTCMTVEHNNLRTNDTVLLQKNGRFEKILIGANALDCSVSGNCGQTLAAYNYCSLTRNRDGTGANDWSAGDAVLNEGNTGDGYIDLYADRSATSEGYPGQVVSDGPVAYWRMNETTSTTTADLMGNVGVATETGTQSNGLGVLSTLLGTGSADPVWQNASAGGHLLIADDTDLRITGDLTIEMWVYFENGGGSDNLLSRGANGEYHLQVASDGTLTVCHGNGSGNECDTTAAGFIPNTTYTHVAVVRDSVSSPKRWLFYKNGVLASTATYTQTVTAQALSTAIGANPGGGGNEWDGNIDEVAIYNYQVPADRLLLHYNARLNNSISKFTVGPTLCGNVRTGTGAFDLSERWCLGNLAGTYSYATSPQAVYGFAAGNASATWVSVDATNGFRIMSGPTEKLKADTSGNFSMTGDLTIGVNGIFRSAAATTLTSGTGLYMAGGTTPVFRVGIPSTDEIKWDGTDLTVKSNNFSIQSGGVFVLPRTVATWGTDYGYNFDSSFSGDKPAMWSYETASERAVRIDNKTTQSGRTSRIALAVDDEDSDAAALTITTGLAASASDADIAVSGISFTVSSNNIVVRGNTGLSTTIVLPCGTVTYTSGVLTNKGTC
jgi:hypothetical protein